ncbi:MAG: hypothetical protein QOJ57_1532 [Thermoleophilaceae bacterium]|jgi:PAS domain S-box-containing protein|nr:hypothetical protein [Thermoleophilaceae bacterium]
MSKTGASPPRAIDPLLAVVPDAVVTIDARGRVVEWNPAAETIFGWPRSDALGRVAAEMIVPKLQRRAHRAGLKRVAGGGPPRVLGRRVEYTALRACGEEFPIELTVVQTGEAPARFSAWIRDVSERRAVEDEAERRKQLFEIGERVALVGGSIRDLRSFDGEWSEGMYRLHGLEPDGVAPPLERVLDRTHPADRERLTALVVNALQQPADLPEEGLSLEYRTISPDKSIRSIRAGIRLQLDGRGRPAKWIGVAHDVTDQQITERALQARHAVTDVLSEWPSFEEGVPKLLRGLGLALDCPFAALWTSDREGQDLVLRCRWSAPDVDAVAFDAITSEASIAGHGIPGLVWATGQPAMFPDVRESLALARGNAAERLGVHSAVAFPALAGDESLAVLSFYSLDRREPCQRMISTLAGIGSELGRFLASRRAALWPSRLSHRELQVLQLAAEGNTARKIAEQLGVSAGTVKTHFENAYKKLGVGDRAAAVALALRSGLIC